MRRWRVRAGRTKHFSSSLSLSRGTSQGDLRTPADLYVLRRRYEPDPDVLEWSQGLRDDQLDVERVAAAGAAAGSTPAQTPAPLSAPLAAPTAPVPVPHAWGSDSVLLSATSTTRQPARPPNARQGSHPSAATSGKMRPTLRRSSSGLPDVVEPETSIGKRLRLKGNPSHVHDINLWSRRHDGGDGRVTLGPDDGGSVPEPEAAPAGGRSWWARLRAIDRVPPTALLIFAVNFGLVLICVLVMGSVTIVDGKNVAANAVNVVSLDMATTILTHVTDMFNTASAINDITVSALTLSAQFDERGRR